MPWNVDLMGRAFATAAVLATLALAVTGCGGSGEGTTEAGGATTSDEPAALTDVADVDDLRGLFDADVGRPRLLLLLSPT